MRDRLMDPTALRSAAGWLAVAVGLAAAAGWSGLAIRFAQGVRGAPSLSATGDPAATGPGPRPSVTAVVPVRNEAANIAECLSCLASQADLHEAFVVDDGSTDGTRGEVERFAASGPPGHSLPVVLLGGEGEAGFGGKPLACQAGADVATGEWLLFVDADTRLSTGALSSALALAGEKGLDALSAVGEIRCPRLWDRLGTPFVFALLNALFRMSDVNDPESDGAYFYGSFVLIRRERYAAIGGHASVAGELVEDKALGGVAKRAGLRIAVARAPGLISAEWAPGLRGWVRALQRVVTPTMRGVPGLSLAFCVAMGLLILAPPLLILAGPSPLSLLLGVFSFLAAVLLTGLAAGLIGARRLYSVLYIVPAAVVAGVLWVSLFKAWRGGTIEWRGREVRLAPHPELVAGNSTLRGTMPASRVARRVGDLKSRATARLGQSLPQEARGAEFGVAPAFRPVRDEGTVARAVAREDAQNEMSDSPSLSG